ncbi:MAG: vitamin K epoxide reductase family protein [Thermoplasmata archaeon]|nr:vitamin K epoxide reductase family protein [Thermoplasmata archaeon]
MDARTLHSLIPIAIVAGLILSGYAAYESTHPSAQGSCSINGFVSCSKVDNSAHTTTFGVQDYWLGVAGFLALLVVDIPLLRTYKAPWLYALLGLSTIGVGVALYLAYIELAVINALCLICTGAYLSNAAVWLASLGLVWERRSSDRDDSADAREGDRPAQRRPSD